MSRNPERRRMVRNVGYAALGVLVASADVFAGYETWHAMATNNQALLPADVVADVFLLGVSAGLTYLYTRPRKGIVIGYDSPDVKRNFFRNDTSSRRNRDRWN